MLRNERVNFDDAEIGAKRIRTINKIKKNSDRKVLRPNWT